MHLDGIAFAMLPACVSGKCLILMCKDAGSLKTIGYCPWLIVKLHMREALGN